LTTFAPDPLPRLHSILDALPLTGTLPPRVLNVGCGAFPSGPTLRAVLPGWSLWGLDINGDTLRRARQLLPGAHLIQASIAALPGLLYAQFGLVMVRHPDVFRGASLWRAALARLPGLLAPGGVLLVTVYTSGEADSIRALPVPLTLSLDESALAAPNLVGCDRWALVFQAEPVRRLS
jgi:SAM-dependent methyltransferase